MVRRSSYCVIEGLLKSFLVRKNLNIGKIKCKVISVYVFQDASDVLTTKSSGVRNSLWSVVSSGTAKNLEK